LTSRCWPHGPGHRRRRREATRSGLDGSGWSLPWPDRRATGLNRGAAGSRPRRRRPPAGLGGRSRRLGIAGPPVGAGSLCTRRQAASAQNLQAAQGRPVARCHPPGHAVSPVGDRADRLAPGRRGHSRTRTTTRPRRSASSAVQPLP
jgi:hypothetical protein